MALNLHQVRVFQAIVNAGSVTRGAKALHISQPAASKQLAELEQSLGTALLQRRARGVLPTSAGKVLHQHATRLFEEERAAERALQAVQDLRQGQLCVGADTTLGNYLVPPVLSELHRQRPGLALELRLGTAQWQCEQLLAGQLDLALSEQEVEHPEVVQEVFLHDELTLIVAPSHALASEYSIAYSRLSQLPWLAREEGSGTRRTVDASLAQRGVTRQPTLCLGSTEALKNAVASGGGVAFVARRAVESDLNSGRLQVLRVAGLTIHRSLFQLTAVGSALSPTGHEFLRLLRRQYPRIA